MSTTTNQSKKGARPKRGEYAPHISPDHARGCEAEGCTEPGVYKAPKSRDDLYNYRWLCLDHVREHNKQWDYFAGLGADEIEDFMKDAVTGHRPTWEREANLSDANSKLHEALYQFISGGGKPRAAPTPPLNAKLRKALSTMDIEYPYTEQQLKGQYRQMVKKYHPDVNKGDKKSEEAFKQITAAYKHLTEHLKNAPAS